MPPDTKNVGAKEMKMQHEILRVMTEKQAADYVQLTPRCFQAYRYKGGGPQYVRISSRCVRYRLEDLEAWLADRLASSTSQEQIV